MYSMLSEQQPYWNYVFLTICCMFMVMTQTFTTIKLLRIFVIYLSYNRTTSSWPAELLQCGMLNASLGCRTCSQRARRYFLQTPALATWYALRFRPFCFHTADTLVSVDTSSWGGGVERGHASQYTGLSRRACIRFVPPTALGGRTDFQCGRSRWFITDGTMCSVFL